VATPDPLWPLANFAASRGWVYSRRIIPHHDTPFLHLGDAVEAGPCLAVTLLGRRAELYEHRRIAIDGAERRVAGAYVVLRLVDGVHLHGIDQLRLMPRGSASLAPLNDRHVVELESLELDQAFVLQVGSGTSELALLRLFTPALISGLLDLAAADAYLGEYFDYAHGRIVLASGGTIAASDGPTVEATLRAVEPVVREVLAVAAP
jgi:hypothetical protein